MASPRMQMYLSYAAEIYSVYLRYVAKEDIHVYSVDEAFLDITHYLPRYGLTPKEMAVAIMEDVLRDVGIPSACGIGTNLYLAKIALDITAKHADDFIGILDEESYKKTLWDYKPLVKFWRIGKKTADALARYGIHTMRDIANADEEMLYYKFGIDAELLIDHAWGREPVTIADIKKYTPKPTSLTSGQVLMRDYTFEEGRLIIKEMMDVLCLSMLDKNVLTHSITVQIGYSNTLNAAPAKGTASLETPSNSDKVIIPAVVALYERIVDKNKPVRRMNISCNSLTADTGMRQMSLFDAGDNALIEKNRNAQKAVLEIKKKYGKNAILKGMNFQEAATSRERNHQIGGHKSGE